MNFMSVNIRGVGNEDKIRWIRRLISVHKISFLCIQETQFSDSSKINYRSIWNSELYERDVVDASGRSGGLLCMWNKERFHHLSSVKSRLYLVIRGKIKGCDKDWFVVNVHGPRNPSSRKVIWQELLALKEANAGIWFFIGDFNAVRWPEERLNSMFDPICAAAFNDFVNNAELFEFAMKGTKFTFCKSNSRKMSKIDRCFVNQDFINCWSDSCFSALPRYLSDHSPIILISDPLDYGPIPFCFFNSWLDEPELETVVAVTVMSFSFDGPPDVVLAEKLKRFKEAIKIWAKAKKVKGIESFDETLAKLKELDDIMEERPLVEEEEWTRSECLKDLENMELKITKDLHKKSRSKWASHGDENSSYFHRIIKHRATSNKIHGL
ncbi:uncharacterized protein LOC110881054 [Helianthus annuus]|uniref:uncharacterized protein LOC110881054 n=1 Tax=Helianthus annuus TaxID=4232 RepID=UPI000B8F23CB|nr:uncharacterized protein LOC110881054 [Helianthus annuus]